MLKEANFEDELVKNKISNFLEENKFSDYTQTIEWNIIRNEPIKYYLYYENDDEEIIWVCSLFDKTSGDEKILYANRGPVLDYENKEIIKCFFEEIENWMIKHKYNKLIINPIIDYEILRNFPENIKYEVTDKRDYKNHKDSCKLAKVDIIYDEEKLISKMDYGIRRNTKKAYKNELNFKVSDNIDFDNFYELYIQTARRHDFKEHDISYFKEIYKVFKKNLKFIEVWHNDIPLAMGIDIIYKNKLVYLYGASSNKYRELRGMYKMHWEAIKYCIDNKIPQYDLGGVFCEEEDIDNKDIGLYRLKKGYCYNGFIDIVPDIIIYFDEGGSK